MATRAVAAGQQTRKPEMTVVAACRIVMEVHQREDAAL